MDTQVTSEKTEIVPDPALVQAVATKVERDEGLIALPKPQARNNSWSAIISIVIILAMVIIGAFYAWGQRITEERTARVEAQQNATSSQSDQ